MFLFVSVEEINNHEVYTFVLRLDIISVLVVLNIDDHKIWRIGGI